MPLKAERLEAQRETSAKALLLRWREEGHRAEAQRRDLYPGSSEACWGLQKQDTVEMGHSERNLEVAICQQLS